MSGVEQITASAPDQIESSAITETELEKENGKTERETKEGKSEETATAPMETWTILETENDGKEKYVVEVGSQSKPKSCEGKFSILLTFYFKYNTIHLCVFCRLPKMLYFCVFAFRNGL